MSGCRTSPQILGDVRHPKYPSFAYCWVCVFMKILPSITTIFDWRGKIKEVKELGLKEVALFLTCVNFKERQELFSLLKDTKIISIPFVHIRSNNTSDELDYLIKNYHTEAFNIHTKNEYSYPPDYKKYKNMIYIENTYESLDEGELKEFAGICLDFGHMENSKLFTPDIYKHNAALIEKYGCGCNHLGPSKDFSFFSKREVRYSRNGHPHTLKNLSELDYLSNYSDKYFGKFVALEMENIIKEQLEAKDYLYDIIKNKVGLLID